MTLSRWIALTACLFGCDPATTTPPGMVDGSVADGGLPDGAVADPFAAILPDASPVEGEGTACELSIECAPMQLCVDDACIRHERLRAEDLSWGEVRTRSLRELLAAAGDPLPRPWTPFLDGRDHDIRTWTVAGPAGVSMLFTVDLETECPIIVANPGLRSAWIEDLRCTALAIGPDGQLWAAGLEPSTQHPIIVELDADDREVARHDLADALDSTIGEATSFTRRAGPVSSLLYADGNLYMSMRAVEGEARELSFTVHEVVFAVVPATGAPRLLDVGGRRVFTDSQGGWLVPRADSTPAALLITRVPGELGEPTPLDLVDLASGARQRWREDYGHSFRYAVLAPGRVEALVWEANEQCDLVSMRDGVELATRPDYIRTRCSRSVGPRPYDVPTSADYPAALGHVAFAGVQVSAAVGATRINLLDRNLALRVEEVPSGYIGRPGAVVFARFGMGIEGVLGLYETGEAFQWYELAITTDGTP